MDELLKGLKVVELASVLAGPAVGMFLAELGADVTKVEAPGGDVTRTWKLPTEDRKATVSAYFSSVNYRKKYITRNLKEPAELADVVGLCHSANVVLSNFRGSRARKFGLDYESLSSKNPDLIFVELQGYLNDAERAAYDLVLQAESGWMSMNGTPESGPLKMPVALMDLLAAHHMKQAVLLALYKWKTTGKGSFIHCTLEGSALSNLANQASNYLMEEFVPARMGSLHPNIAPYGETFICSCGHLITLAVGSDQQFARMCDILGNAQLSEDERFNNNAARVINRTELDAELRKLVANHDRKSLLATFHDAGVPAGAIKSLDEVFAQTGPEALIREEEIEGYATKRVTSVPFIIQ
ncbi:MAG: CoA transferase [Flavobacteriales bacterium]|nr:CoA transferase [Flavobacteriales bacterium]